MRRIALLMLCCTNLLLAQQPPRSEHIAIEGGVNEPHDTITAEVRIKGGALSGEFDGTITGRDGR